MIEFIKNINEHFAIKALLTIAAISSVAIGIWQWGQSVNEKVNSLRDPKALAVELAENEQFILELATVLSSEPKIIAKLKGATGEMGPIGPQGRAGEKGEPGITLSNTCFDYCQHAKKECLYGEYYHFPVHYNTKRFSCGNPINLNQSYACVCDGDSVDPDKDPYN